MRRFRRLRPRPNGYGAGPEREHVELAESGKDPVSAAVLAGGRSARMGHDKRRIEVEGVPLLLRVVTALAAVSDDVQVILADPADVPIVEALLDGMGARDQLRITLDLRPGEGPVAGLEAALAGARHDAVLTVATDHPYLEPTVLRGLVALLEGHPDRTVAAVRTTHGPQPLLAVYRRSALVKVRELLDAGERRATAVLAALDPLYLDGQEPGDTDGPSTWDVDTPEELAALRPRPSAGDRGGSVRPVRVHRVRVGDTPATQAVGDHLVAEDPLELRAAGPGQRPRTVVTTLRTRGADEDLAAGWLWSEGLLQLGGIAGFSRGEPVTMAHPDDQLTVHLTHPLDLDSRMERHATATASCGVCGRASIDELAARVTPVSPEEPSGTPLPWERLAGFPDRLRDAQPLFAATGGLHATGLFAADGTLVTLREDVGRHNALDAAIGHHVRADDIPLSRLIGVLSGRIGFELVAKAAAAGLPILAAVGAPTALAVRTAQRLGITLVGFLRGGDGNVYTSPERLDLPGDGASG